MEKKIKILPMRSVRSMVIGEKLYVNPDFFSVVMCGEDLEYFDAAVYMNKNAFGTVSFIDRYVLVEKIDKDKFSFIFPMEVCFIINNSKIVNEELFYPATIINSSDIFVEKIQDEKSSEITEKDSSTEINDVPINEINPENYYCFYLDLVDYISGPLFLIDTEVVTQKLIFLPEILLEYVGLFTVRDRIKDLLQESKAAKKRTEETYEDGIRKVYLMRVYDVIISTIEKEIHETYEDETVDVSNHEEDIYSHMSKADLNKALDQAIEEKNEKNAIRISDELTKRG